MDGVKKEKFSYSKISTFEQCKYKYKLIYRDSHYIQADSIATEFGTLVHYIEETMAKIITTTFKLDANDYKYLIDLFYEADIKNETETVLGVNKLKEKYKDVWNVPDKANKTYQDKVLEYVNFGIYRLREYLKANPDLEIVGIEQEFNLEFNGVLFHGFIDRVFRNTSTNQILIEDIKTWDKPEDEDHLKTPLQFVIYTLAAKEIYNVSEDLISCAYELPLCDIKQPAGTKGYIKRGTKKLLTLLEEIKSEDFEPTPSPLCHWCIFSETYPDQPDEAKKLCPYYSH